MKPFSYADMVAGYTEDWSPVGVADWDDEIAAQAVQSGRALQSDTPVAWREVA